MDVLASKEAESIDYIYEEYKGMVSEIHTFLLGFLDVRFGSKYRSEESTLIGWLPEEIKAKLGGTLMDELSMKAWNDELNKIAEQIVAIGSSPLQFMGVKLKPTTELGEENESYIDRINTSENIGENTEAVAAGDKEENEAEEETDEKDELSAEEKERLREMDCSIASSCISDSVERIDQEISALTKIVKHEFGYSLEYNWKSQNIKKYGKKKNRRRVS